MSFPLLGLLIIGIMSVIGSSKPGQEIVTLLSELLFLLAFLVCFYIASLFLILVVMRIVKPGFFKNTIYTFNDWGMHKKAGKAEYSRPWKGFTRWGETRSFFYLYMPNNDAHMISKKSLQENEQKEFRTFLTDRFSPFEF